MISYFHHGITDLLPSKDLDLPQLVKLIRNNPNKDIIEEIRILRLNGDEEEYKKLKKSLPYVTPNCKLRARSLKKNADDLEKNLISFTQYLYIDIDVKSDVDQYKEYFINNYGHQALLVCKSCSGGGISVLYRISTTITVNNFEDIWLAVQSTILKDEKIDEKCKNIGRAMFVSSDPDLYVNWENEIDVDLTINNTKEITKEVNQYNSCETFLNSVDYPISRIPYNEFIKVLKFETQVEVHNPIVDFIPVQYIKIFVPKNIKDGTKHTLYARIIYTLVYLNPTINKDYFLSYLFFINSNFAKPRMDPKELIRYFDFIYDGIITSGTVKVQTSIRNVHFNPYCNISRNQRTKIANYINGAHRRSITIDKIQDAIQTIIQIGGKVTQKEVARLSGLNVKTVRTHFNAERIDMDHIIQDINLQDFPIENDPVEGNEADFNEQCLYFYNTEKIYIQ